MKIAIVSCYHIHNYGSVLQAYATQEYLTRLGAECRTVETGRLNAYFSQRRKKYYLKNLLDGRLLLRKYPMAELRLLQKLSPRLGRQWQRRQEGFRTFRKCISFLENDAVCPEALAGVVGGYDAILLGSDQLWRPDNIFQDYYTLNWAPEDIPKYAYATSFGISRLDKDSCLRAKAFLPRFTAVSVRECHGRQLVKRLTGQDVPVVCDPVLLLTSREWSEISDCSRCPDRPYILTCFMGKKDTGRRFARMLAQKTGMPVVGIVCNDCYVARDEKLDHPIADASPEQFLGLIENAAYVCTDSFHAVAFSVLFRREFYCFSRNSGTESRLESFLSCLGLQDRFLGKGEWPSATKIDYPAVEEKSKVLISAGDAFMRQIMEKENEK